MRTRPVDPPAAGTAAKITLRGSDVLRDTRVDLVGGRLAQPGVADDTPSQKSRMMRNAQGVDKLPQLAGRVVGMQQNNTAGTGRRGEPGVAGDEDAPLVHGAPQERGIVGRVIVGGIVAESAQPAGQIPEHDIAEEALHGVVVHDLSSIILLDAAESELLVLLRHLDEISQALFKLLRPAPSAVDKRDADPSVWF